MKKTDPGYEQYRERQAEISRERSQAGREIGPLPKVAHPRSRKQCARSFRKFCETYLAARFPLPWSADHLKVIERMQVCTLDGGQFALAMPRGSGKTTLAESCAIWALVYGHRRFVVLIGSTEAAAEEILESIRTELESNDKLAEDFPAVCYPIRSLEGIANRANGQTLDGERTRIGWTSRELVLPTVAGASSSGAVLRVAGITGRIRGMRATTSDGKSIRPDLVVIDDPQTDESARSPTQNAYRERILAGAVLGLAGPGRKIAVVMPCTVIAPGDTAERILDRDRHPQWNGERTKLVYAFPTDEWLWEEYARIRADGMRAGDDGRAATEFYREHREAMDAGSQVAWAERLNPDELSAIQHAMNKRLDNPAAFAAEYQNEPIAETAGPELVQLDADPLAQRLTRLPRGTVPVECTRLTAGIDVQGGILYWLLAGWDESFGGSIVDYGTFPKQNRSYFTAADARPSLSDQFRGMADGPAIYAGLQSLCDEVLGRSWIREGGAESLSISLCLIDSGWQTDVVHEFCRRSAWSRMVQPSKGRGLRAGDRPMNEWRKSPGDRVGTNWRIDAPSGRSQGRHVLVDTNSWKSFIAERLLAPLGAPGTLRLPGDKPHDHQLLADHLGSEYRVRTEGRGRTVEEWRLRPERPDNHWWDCLILSAVAASVMGLGYSAATPGSVPAPTPKQKIKLSELQKQKRGGA